MDSKDELPVAFTIGSGFFDLLNERRLLEEDPVLGVNTKYQSTQNGIQQLPASLVLLNPYFTPLQSIQISVRFPYSW